MAKDDKVIPIRRRPGRPSIRGDQKVLYIRLPKDVVDELEKRCAESLRSITSEVEYSLRLFFKKGK